LAARVIISAIHIVYKKYDVGEVKTVFVLSHASIVKDK
jgi:hypothetical protein